MSSSEPTTERVILRLADGAEAVITADTSTQEWVDLRSFLEAEGSDSIDVDHVRPAGGGKIVKYATVRRAAVMWYTTEWLPESK